MTQELEHLKAAAAANGSSWQKIGELKSIPLTEHVEDRSKLFNQKDYHHEKSQDVEQMLLNHHEFCRKFGHTAFSHDYHPSFSQSFMTTFTGEKISTMDYSTFKYHKNQFGRFTDEEIKAQYLHQIQMEAESYLKQHWILSMLVLHLGLGSMIKYFAEALDEKITHYQVILNYLSNPSNIPIFDR